MVVDTSALVAHVLGEPEGDRVLRALEQEADVALSAVVVLDTLLERLGVVVAPVTAEQVALAREAFLRFGKGRHPAALNFGDCFSYALAAHRGESLLFVGKDFARTDVQGAPY